MEEDIGFLRESLSVVICVLIIACEAGAKVVLTNGNILYIMQLRRVHIMSFKWTINVVCFMSDNSRIAGNDKPADTG